MLFFISYLRMIYIDTSTMTTIILDTLMKLNDLSIKFCVLI